MKKIIAIDFDGTCVTHDFPRVGKDIGAVPVLKRMVENGAQLILFTMRSNHIVPPIVEGDDKDIIKCEMGNYLDDAVNWFKENGIELWGIQTNPDQLKWTTSPKTYAQLYIDDCALGCPLIFKEDVSSRPYVDWAMVEQLLFPEE